MVHEGTVVQLENTPAINSEHPQRKKKRTFLPFEEARKEVRALRFKSEIDWRRWSRTERPLKIPGNPHKIYKDSGWNGISDWLGIEKKANILLSQRQLARKRKNREYARKSNANNRKQKISCLVCQKKMTKKSFFRHVRIQHPEKMEELGVKPLLKKRNDPIFYFIKRLVYSCHHNYDRRRKKKFGNVSILKDEEIDALAVRLMEKIRQSKRLGNKPCRDDVGVYLKNGFDFEQHSIFALSLDRIDNEKPHFPNANDITNIRFVIRGLNHSTNPSSVKNFTKIVRERHRHGKTKNHEAKIHELYDRLKKPFSNGRRNIAYSCASNIFQLDEKSREQFKTFGEFWKYAKSLLIKQGFQCAVSNILMDETCDNSKAGQRRFAPSLDAIDPRKGHLKGNLRWICAFLNITCCDKIKTEDFSDDKPTQWTREIFVELFECTE